MAMEVDPCVEAGEHIEGCIYGGVPKGASPVDLEAIKYAWTEEGPVPSYHQRAKRQLKRDWPRLWEALTDTFGGGS